MSAKYIIAYSQSQVGSKAIGLLTINTFVLKFVGLLMYYIERVNHAK